MWITYLIYSWVWHMWMTYLVTMISFEYVWMNIYVIEMVWKNFWLFTSKIFLPNELQNASSIFFSKIVTEWLPKFGDKSLVGVGIWKLSSNFGDSLSPNCHQNFNGNLQFVDFVYCQKNFSGKLSTFNHWKTVTKWSSRLPPNFSNSYGFDIESRL